MTPLLQVGSRIVTALDIIPLLSQYDLLPQLLRELMIDQAIASIALPPEDIDRLCRQFYQEQQITDDAALQSWLQQKGITLEQLNVLATRPAKIDQFKQTQWGGNLESYFLTCKDQLDEVVYSLIRTPEPEVAQELYFRIRAGEQSFADLARQYSQGSEAETGGLVGPMPLTQPNPVLAEKLLYSQPGQLHPPIRLDEWYVIVRLEKLIPARLDEATRQRLLDRLFEAWIEAQFDQPSIEASSSNQLIAVS